MSDEATGSIISHLSLGTNDLDASAAFYDRVLATLGCRRIMEHPGAIAYGRAFPEFWIQQPIDGEPAETANGSHVGFLASARTEVDAFHATAIAAGGTDDGLPGPREEYGAAYYGCFVRDPDGHKVEAIFWDAALAAASGAP